MLLDDRVFCRWSWSSSCWGSDVQVCWHFQIESTGRGTSLRLRLHEGPIVLDVWWYVTVLRRGVLLQRCLSCHTGWAIRGASWRGSGLFRWVISRWSCCPRGWVSLGLGRWRVWWWFIRSYLRRSWSFGRGRVRGEEGGGRWGLIGRMYHLWCWNSWSWEF